MDGHGYKSSGGDIESLFSATRARHIHLHQRFRYAPVLTSAKTGPIGEWTAVGFCTRLIWTRLFSEIFIIDCATVDVVNSAFMEGALYVQAKNGEITAPSASSTALQYRDKRHFIALLICKSTRDSTKLKDWSSSPAPTSHRTFPKTKELPKQYRDKRVLLQCEFPNPLEIPQN
jgi:hypothetical protein